MTETNDSTLLENHLQKYRGDLDHLIQTLQSPGIPEESVRTVIGLFGRLISPLKQDLVSVKELINQGRHEQAWELLREMQRQSTRLISEAQSFLGGMAIRRTALDQGMSDKALLLAQTFSERTGFSWSPAVAFGPSVVDDCPESFLVAIDAGDDLIRMPIPRWDIWHLPLVAHDFAYWLVKQSRVKEFDVFIADQIKLAQRINHDDNPPAPKEVSCLLPELREALAARRQILDVAAFQKQSGPTLELYYLRQKVHLWHLIADALATYLMGPAYAHALVFLALNPTNPLIEGASANKNAAVRSRFLPSDARRAAIALYTLKRMSDEAKTDLYTDGLYDSEWKLLTSVWERALEVANFREDYRELSLDMVDWHQAIYNALGVNFNSLPGETAAQWQEGRNKVVPMLQNGTKAGSKISLESVIHGAWWCRSRYPDRTSRLSRDCTQLLEGAPSQGMFSEQIELKDEASRLLNSRLYEIENDLNRLRGIFNSNTIERSDRDAVAGRFYRLLSEHDYSVKRLQKLLPKNPPLGSTLMEVMRQSEGDQMQALRRETLDFLGGVLMRKENLDRGICGMAEALLRDYSRMTGVNWASRVVLGSNPLFSQASDIVHHRFPDWSIWSLPLMAHEFGHVTAPATPAFKAMLAEELVNVTEGHPEVASWNEEDLKAYVGERGRHLEEFFADAFAVYCQGPAFAYNVILIHLNPAEAYLRRGNHPTHAERAELILQVMGAMNQQEKFNEYDNGPYEGVLKRLRDWWFAAVKNAGVQPKPVDQFHKLKAIDFASKFYTLLNKYYRLGAQYQASEWLQAEDAAQQLLGTDSNLLPENLRNLLNIAWACRVRYPLEVAQIAKIISSSFERALAQSQIPEAGVPVR